MLKNPDAYVKEYGICIDGSADRLAMPTVEPYDNSLILVFEEGDSLLRQDVESILMSMSAIGIDYFIIKLLSEVHRLNERMFEILYDPDDD